jgi:hypothetical protein
MRNSCHKCAYTRARVHWRTRAQSHTHERTSTAAAVATTVTSPISPATPVTAVAPCGAQIRTHARQDVDDVVRHPPAAATHAPRQATLARAHELSTIPRCTPHANNGKRMRQLGDATQACTRSWPPTSVRDPSALRPSTHALPLELELAHADESMWGGAACSKRRMRQRPQQRQQVRRAPPCAAARHTAHTPLLTASTAAVASAIHQARCSSDIAGELHRPQQARPARPTGAQYCSSCCRCPSARATHRVQCTH